MSYLKQIEGGVEMIVSNGNSPDSLLNLDIERCGKSRIPLNGFVTDLHAANLQKIYGDLNEKKP